MTIASPVQQSKAVKTIAVQTRLPTPAGFDASFWQILCEVIFPQVQNPRSILLAVQYCHARKLDILKRPVNIVPMWNSALRREVDTIWPSITETQITAARTHEWAGLDPPRFGEWVTDTFKGRRKDANGGWSEAAATVSFYEWCEVTVYRHVRGERRAFTERVYWREIYGRVGGSPLPNDTWKRRATGQLIKVAKAAALRAAFPEEDSSPTADEMAGGIIDEDVGAVAEQPRTPITEVPQHAGAQVTPAALTKGDDENWTEWGQRLIADVRTASDADVVDQWKALNADVLTKMKTDAPKLHTGLMRSIDGHKETLPSDTGEETQ